MLCHLSPDNAEYFYFSECSNCAIMSKKKEKKNFHTLYNITTIKVFLSSNRNFRYIKLSSPCLNTTMIAGCMLIYAAVIFLGIDDATLPSILTFSSVCTVSIILNNNKKKIINIYQFL